MNVGAKTKRDLVLLVVLVALHEGLKRFLAGGVLVSSLLAPVGIESAATLVAALLFVVVRLTLYVGVPGWLAAQLAIALAARVAGRLSRPCLYR